MPCVAGPDSPSALNGQFPVPKMALELLEGRAGGAAGAAGAGKHLEDLPNEISAPYEVPQFPIEQIETRLAMQRQLSVR